MDTGFGLMLQWFAVAEIVRRERRYQRQLVTNRLLTPAVSVDLVAGERLKRQLTSDATAVADDEKQTLPAWPTESVS
jgi:hypothetical protein